MRTHHFLFALVLGVLAGFSIFTWGARTGEATALRTLEHVACAEATP